MRRPAAAACAALLGALLGACGGAASSNGDPADGAAAPVSAEGCEPSVLPTPDPEREPGRDNPAFVVLSEPPRVVNRREVARALQASYAPELRDRRVEGTVELLLAITVTGTVHEARVRKGSGYLALDRAAVEVGKVMRFEPAMEEGCPKPVWTAVPLTFRVRG